MVRALTDALSLLSLRHLPESAHSEATGRSPHLHELPRRLAFFHSIKTLYACMGILGGSTAAASVDRTASLKSLGYTEREAGFLSLVALHGGYFLRRQYQVFAGGLRGPFETRLLRRALAAGHVELTTHTNRTQLYRLISRAVFRAIGEADSRNRRKRSPASIKARLMALDFVLAHPSSRFLATSGEKCTYFCEELGVDPVDLPTKAYGSQRAGGPSLRCFIEQYPIFLDSPRNSTAVLPHFCFIDEGALSTQGFVSFVGRYRSLLTAIRRFVLVYVAAEYPGLQRGRSSFDRLEWSLSEPDSRLPRGDEGEYFRFRRLLETRQYGQLNKAKLDRLRDLSLRYRDPKIEEKYRRWATEVTLTEQRGPVRPSFETYWLKHYYDPFSSVARA